MRISQRWIPERLVDGPSNLATDLSLYQDILCASSFSGHLSQYAIPVCQHIFVFTCRLALQDQKISFFTINLSFGAALKQGEAPLYPRAEDLLRV